MLYKGKNDGFEGTRAQYVASLLKQAQQANVRSARRREIEPLTTMAERLHQLVFFEHHLEIIKRLSSATRHPHWDECKDDREIGLRYEMLHTRERADEPLQTSLNNIRFDLAPKLGRNLLPELEELAAWHEQHPEIEVAGKGPFAPRLRALIEEAKQIEFFTKALTLGNAAGAARG